MSGFWDSRRFFKWSIVAGPPIAAIIAISRAASAPHMLPIGGAVTGMLPVAIVLSYPIGIIPAVIHAGIVNWAVRFIKRRRFILLVSCLAGGFASLFLFFFMALQQGTHFLIDADTLAGGFFVGGASAAIVTSAFIAKRISEQSRSV